MVADWLQSLGSVGSILLGGGGWEGEEILKKCLSQVKIWSHFIKLVWIIFWKVILTIKQNLSQIFLSVPPKQTALKHTKNR